MSLLNYLNIGFFNINGIIGQKTFDPSFENLIKKYDIIALTETWHTNDTCIQNLKENIPENYLYFQNARKNKHKKSKRNSGGIIMLYQKNLRNVISLTDNKTENMLWIKIRNYHCFEKNINLGVIYNSPINSSYTKKQTNDFYCELQNKLTTFSSNEYVLIGGDFNARTGMLNDYIDENESDRNFINLPDEYEIDQFTRKRNNQDIHTNSYGEKLIDFSISTKMRILNGRTLGDFQGKITYIGYNGVSTIDYILASESFLMRKYIQSFNVEDLTSLSDHRPLTLKLKYIKNKEIKQNPTNLLPRPKRFCFKNLETYRKKLENEMNLNTITSITEKLEKCTNEKDI